MKKFLLIGTGMVALAALVAAGNSRQHRREAVAARVVLAAKCGRMEAEIESAQTKITALAREQADLRARLDTLQQATPPGAMTETKGPEAEASPTAKTALEAKPEVAVKRKELEALARTQAQIQELADERLRGATVYQALFRSLQLSPEQIDAFLDISARQHERVMDLGAMEEQGLIAKNDPAIQKMRADGVAAELADYRRLLGEEGFQRFMEIGKKATAREIIGGFGAQAAMAGMPLSVRKLDQLVAAVAAAYIPNAGWRSEDGRYATWQFDPIYWDFADTLVRPLLSDAEWNFYKSRVPERAFYRLWTLAWQANQMDAEQAKVAAPAKPPVN